MPTLPKHRKVLGKDEIRSGHRQSDGPVSGLTYVLKQTEGLEGDSRKTPVIIKHDRKATKARNGKESSASLPPTAACPSSLLLFRFRQPGNHQRLAIQRHMNDTVLSMLHKQYPVLP